MRITAPPIRHPCHYGIDMSTREEMIAHDRTEAEIAAELGADSLAYLSLEGVYAAIEGDRATHCDACFSGEYPLENTGSGQHKDAFENALPLVKLCGAAAERSAPLVTDRRGLWPPRGACALRWSSVCFELACSSFCRSAAGMGVLGCLLFFDMALEATGRPAALVKPLRAPRASRSSAPVSTKCSGRGRC